MRAWISCSVVACLLLALLPSPGHPQGAAQTGTLTGSIAGADGQPKSFARVQLQGSAVYAAVSDVTGKFTINNFTAGGTYRIIIRQNDNVETQTRQIKEWTLPLVVHW
jgi:hypothetical protein